MDGLGPGSKDVTRLFDCRTEGQVRYSSVPDILAGPVPHTLAIKAIKHALNRWSMTLLPIVFRIACANLGVVDG